MKNQVHPDFRRRFNRNAVGSLLAAFLFAAVAYLARGKELGHLSVILFVLFAFSIFYGVVSSFYRLYNVRCPSCLGKTETQKDANNERWVVDCQTCRIRWDLEAQVN